ncbi:hypothetical protein U9M48_024159 [Paspalum notatum var. saurae]|uniref:Uncharacterized protein n=1 Tax=Paspalum notatum var. saurae TaxID=547442 RepID=A0AAQ3TQ99_PASNO
MSIPCQATSPCCTIAAEYSRLLALCVLGTGHDWILQKSIMRLCSCADKSILVKYVSIAHPRAHGQWIRELPYVVCSLRMQPSKPLNGNTPFFMVYGSEAVLPSDLAFGAPRLTFKDIAKAKAARMEDLDLLEEERLNSVIQSARYQQTLRHYHDHNMRPRAFRIGDLVLCRVLKNVGSHKLSTPWEGPYIVTEVSCPGSYRLSEMDGTPIENSWSIEHLRKFYA